MLFHNHSDCDHASDLSFFTNTLNVIMQQIHALSQTLNCMLKVQLISLLYVGYAQTLSFLVYHRSSAKVLHPPLSWASCVLCVPMFFPGCNPPFLDQHVVRNTS